MNTKTYRKIDIYVGWEYEVSTLAYPTLKEAKESFCNREYMSTKERAMVEAQFDTTI